MSKQTARKVWPSKLGTVTAPPHTVRFEAEDDGVYAVVCADTLEHELVICALMMLTQGKHRMDISSQIRWHRNEIARLTATKLRVSRQSDDAR